MKKIKISIIIPCLNESENITATLKKLQALRLRGHEVILSDGGSTDNTIELSSPLIDNCIHSKPGRAKQMNKGAEVASGDLLCFIHADTIVAENFDEIILRKISQSMNKKSSSWGFFTIKLNSSRWPFRIIEWLINRRSCLTKVATGDQGIFIDRVTFSKLSGFADIPLMEDIEISKRLRKLAKPNCIKSPPLITSCRRWEKHGIISTVILMWQLRLRYFLGTQPSTLAKAYSPHKTNNTPLNNKKCTKQLIVFVKNPEPGQCKTRLTPFLSDQQASEFYKSLVNTCFDNISNLVDTDISIYTYPDINHPFIKDLNLRHTASIHKQMGKDLGERMFHAIEISLQKYKKSILIGTDCPILDKTYLSKAFKALDQHDMVIGPAEDGGYVLIGATKIQASLFNNINWGTDSVLKQSIKNNDSAGYKTLLLDMLWDIDTPDDYLQYKELITQQPKNNTAQET